MLFSLFLSRWHYQRFFFFFWKSKICKMKSFLFAAFSRFFFFFIGKGECQYVLHSIFLRRFHCSSWWTLRSDYRLSLFFTINLLSLCFCFVVVLFSLHLCCFFFLFFFFYIFCIFLVRCCFFFFPHIYTRFECYVRSVFCTCAFFVLNVVFYYLLLFFKVSFFFFFLCFLGHTSCSIIPFLFLFWHCQCISCYTII